MKLIDKSAVVAEIERRKRKLLDNIICEGDKEWVVRTAHQLNRILLFLDSIEMEEMDLDREIRCYRMRNPIIQHREESLYDYMANVAKHFFELGMRFSAIGSDYIEGVSGYYETTTK